MDNRRSYLDPVNDGRRQRPSASLEDLSRTLDELERRIRRSHDDRDDDRRLSARRPAEEGFHYHDPYQGGRGERWPGPSADDRRVADELHALREELRHQLGSGLHREFAALRDDIEQALRSSGSAGQVAELGVEFERLSDMIQKLAERGGDRQVELLRLEMEEVKGALGKLASDETVQSFERRWDEFDQRWNDIAGRISTGGPDGASQQTLDALIARVAEIGDTVGALPTRSSLGSLEQTVRELAEAMDQLARRQDAIGPEVLAAVDERLDEISRAIAASTPGPMAAVDTEPFERIEARISSLARQVDELVEDDSAKRLADQFAALAQRVDDLARHAELPDETVARMAGQIEAIAERLDRGGALPDLDALFGGLESRIVSLSAMLEQRHEDALVQGQSLLHDLQRRVETIAVTIDGGDGDPERGALLLQAMDDRFAELASRLERQQAEAAGLGGVDSGLLHNLEAQMSSLAELIAQPGAALPDADGIVPRLENIERSIMESRQEVIEAARHAAEEAVRNFTGAPGDSPLVEGLAEDLKTLEALTRRSDDRNARTFEAIHDTLLKIVDRLGMLEGMRATDGEPASERDTLAQTPSLDMDEPMPLAGGWQDADEDAEPDLEPEAERAELRSAASAAAEAAADAVRSEVPEVAEQPLPRSSMLSGLTRALSRHKAARDKAEPVSEAIEDVAAEVETVSDAPEIEAGTPLDPQLANEPLEPGSGAPDLNAIMRRVRDERDQPMHTPISSAAKSDFIAAARRAAQAAAAEAEIMKRNPDDKAKSQGFSFGRLLGRRKAMLMGAAAILLAVVAVQAGRSYFADAPAPAQQAAAVEPSASAPQEQESIETRSVRMADEELPATAQSRMTATPQNAEEVTATWLDTAAATALPEPGILAQPEELAEIENLPQPDEELLAAIPVAAGPIALREAAATGDPKALFEIGNRYAEGRGVAEDTAAAAEWFEKAAEEGLAPAQYRIGNLYEKGVGVERDIAMAKKWYELAAAQGNASAMHNLAVLHAMGADGITDNEKAARLFTQAAELGVRDSQFNLGILAAKGVGVKQDLEEAYKWFAIVAKSGDRDAAAKRDEVASVLSPEQVERARGTADLWRAQPVDAEANSVEIPESWSESGDTTAGIGMQQAVRSVQQLLKASGYDAGSEDGVLGQKTRDAIAAFQKAVGMAPTGEIDEPLVRALLAGR